MLWTFLKFLATFQGYHLKKWEKTYQVNKTWKDIPSTLKSNNFIQVITAKISMFMRN